MSDKNVNQGDNRSKTIEWDTVWQICSRLLKNKAFLFICLLAVVCLTGFVFFSSRNRIQPVIENSSIQADTYSSFDINTESTVEATTEEAVASKTESTQPTTAKSSATAKPTEKPLWIKVTIDKQNVTVYDAKNRIVESFVCSTGLPGSDTPKGTYKIQERGYSFFSKTYQEGAYYWTQFSGDFLFHSVPFDKNRNIETAEAAKLGTKASHGCVRLSMDNAKWIYDNIPRGTKVVIE